MAHHHDHGNDHGHHHEEAPSALSFEEKMAKLIDHWLQHNTDHAKSYREWAEKARDHQLEGVGEILEDIAASTLAMNRKFEEIGEKIKKKWFRTVLPR